MTICGIKLTQNGGIALIDNGKLIFSYEMEKIDNLPQYSEFCIGMDKINEIMLEHGYNFYEIDSIVIDGWDDYDHPELNTGVGKNRPEFTMAWDNNRKIRVNDLARYGHLVNETEDILACKKYNAEGKSLPYNSYMHVAGHVMGVYCTSPFAQKKQDSFILVWDGGMPPQLFYYRCRQNDVQNLGCLFYFTGNVYIDFARVFEPFSLFQKEFTIAGKVMAYMGQGKPQHNILEYFRQTFNELNELAGKVKIDMDVVAVFTSEFIKQAKKFCDTNAIAHQDMLASFQVFLQELILENLEKKVCAYPDFLNNICFAGGCALNIKWNNTISNSKLFRELWIPPFPNDSGSAIGTACCEMVMKEKISALEWDVYSGPMIKNVGRHELYTASDCSLEKLAYILHEYNEPVVFMNGRAELGPRALGNRSILAAAVSPEMKQKLNNIKGREAYCTVAPVCLEEDAPEIFDPGHRDPYVLYEHQVRSSWKDKVPAICHVDGTARLQTINKQQNPGIYFLLRHYKGLSGIPLLCNTSANFNGKGLFPDINSVMEWGKINFIWHAGKLYTKRSVSHLFGIGTNNVRIG